MQLCKIHRSFRRIWMADVSIASGAFVLSRLTLTLLVGVVGMAHGAESKIDEELAKGFAAGELDGLHSVLVIKDKEIQAESYFPGPDQRWGTPLGEREHGPDTLHDLRSVTKPIVGLLYGIALAEGAVPSLEDVLVDQFPEYPDLAKESERRAILVKHVLSMKMGIEWNEELSYDDPANSEIAMERSNDRYRYVLERKLTNAPGDYWVYNGGAVAVAAKLIADGVGMPIDEYAEKKLFAPLGITDYEWVHGEDQVPSAASGLRMKIHDLARLGQLVIDNGTFEGKQIVPASWLSQSFKPYSSLENGLRYGLFWWLAPWGDPPAWVAGFGNGGQRLTVQSEHDLIIVIFAGNYNQADAWQIPVKVIEKYVVPALME